MAPMMEIPEGASMVRVTCYEGVADGISVNAEAAGCQVVEMGAPNATMQIDTEHGTVIINGSSD